MKPAHEPWKRLARPIGIARLRKSARGGSRPGARPLSSRWRRASLKQQVEARGAALASLRGTPAEEEEFREREVTLALEAV